MKMIKLSLAGVMALGAIAASTASANALENIISNPKVNLEIRPRYEYVDQDGFKDKAKAFTVRTALGLQAELFEVEGLKAEIQGMNVANFGFNDYAIGKTDPAFTTKKYPIIADPAQSRVTQANISYTVDGFTAIVGRKMVVLDNARFIGNVGWRQMPQTYDLAAVIYNGIENLNLLGAYVNRVHQVFKDAQFDTGSVLLHASYKVMPELTVTAYDYLIENFADTYGLRLTGTVNFNDAKISYTAEYAKQDDPSITDSSDPNLMAALYQGPANVNNIKQDTEYYNVNVGVNYNGIIAGIGYEYLGDKGSGNTAFQTPLATLHAMNGWADLFLSTPNEGLEDLSIKLGYNAGQYGKIVGIYHDFQSVVKNTAGDDDLGTEIDIAYNYKITKNLGLLLKYADYSAGDKSFNKSDTTKYWVQLDYKFSTGF